SSTLARINPGLQRLAKFMEQAKAYEASSSHSPSSSSPDSFSSTSTTQPTPAANTSAPPHNPRSEEDALILDNGVPHFVSGKHWAWMAAELQDIQSVLTESQKSSSPEGTLDDVIWEADSPAKASFNSNGGTSCGPTKIDAFQPLVMSIFYAAVNSIKDTDVATMFGMDKVSLLNRYRMGTEMLLKRQKFMTSRIFEVLQAFVILLTAQYREDDMGKVWPLTGLAIRIAMLQGLHRDPLALPLGTIDVVQVELRRRLWAQICYLDFRTAEDHGFAPSIHASDFDTRRPITHASRKRLRNGLNGSVIDESQSLVKLQELLQTATGLAGELERGLDELVRYCDKRTKFWVMFWMQIPRQNREKIISPAMRRNIFVDAATAVETWCTISSSPACEPYQWHITSHAGFNLILYVLS
ncbi:hypothetical protein ASPNIDRAFT_132624, partial [Aspergillus niger ATCC 1015]